MSSLRPFRVNSEGSLNFLKKEISPQMWKYINNSAMLPDSSLERRFEKNVTELEDLNIHMMKCNKSAIIISKPIAIRLHKALTQLNKPSYFGKDILVELFAGYKFTGYFPPNLVLRVRYIFDAGIFEWWQKYFDFAIATKNQENDEYSIFNISKRSNTIKEDRNFTAVTVLSLIPGTGLLVSFIAFICFERKILQDHVLLVVKECYGKVLVCYKRFKKFMYKLHSKYKVRS